MARTIYQILDDECQDKGLVDIPHLKERLSSSVGAHILNLRNLDLQEHRPQDAFYDSGQLENFRLHVVMMCPSGFGKSTSFRFLLGRAGLLSKCKLFDTTLRSTFTEESWMGTSINNEGKITTRSGLFARYRRGIIGADEFMRFVGMMDTTQADRYSNEEVYLLTALDTDTMTKDMATASIEETGIGTTLWAGSRIAGLDMKHGLARRVLFQIFIPTPSICAKFRESMRSKKRKNRITEDAMEEMNIACVDALKDMQDIKEINYDSLYDYLAPQKHIPHFEIQLLKRIAMGFSVARNTLPDIVMDETMIGLIQDELRNRAIIRGNPELEIVKRAIEDSGEISGKNLTAYLSQWYQFNDNKVRQLMGALTAMREVKKESGGHGEYVYSIRNTNSSTL